MSDEPSPSTRIGTTVPDRCCRRSGGFDASARLSFRRVARCVMVALRLVIIRRSRTADLRVLQIYVLHTVNVLEKAHVLRRLINCQVLATESRGRLTLGEPWQPHPPAAALHRRTSEGTLG